MSAFIKSIFKSFKSNLGRFFLVLAIIFVSLTFSSGLGSTTPSIKKSYQKIMEENNVSDVLIKCKDESGLTSDNISKISSFNNLTFDSYLTFDEKYSDIYNRIYYKDLTFSNVNKLVLKSGRLPLSSYEVVLEDKIGDIEKHELNEKMKISVFSNEIEVTVVGFVENPLYSSSYNEPCLIDFKKSISNFVYFSSSYDLAFLNKASLIKNEISLIINDKPYELLDRKYEKYITNYVDKLRTYFNDSHFSFLTLETNAGYMFFKKSCDKITLISWVFPLFFILICTLVCSISFSKYISDERNIIACYVSLGVKESKIKFKYLLFAFLTTFIGGVLGIFFGLYLLPTIVYPAFKVIVRLNKLYYSPNFLIGLLSLSFLLLVVLSLVYSLIRADLNEKPIDLLKAKSPKPGKRILLEKIPFIWKHLKFKIKSSIRNIFRYKKNSVLIVLSMMGSSVLLFLGMGLLDNSFALKNNAMYKNIADPMKTISVVVVLIALILCGLIVFNLTNMNISSRIRELSTLKVLGYKDEECSFYTFREIFSLSIFGSILGLPIGYIIFKYIMIWLDFGSIDNVNWYSYILSFTLVIVMSLIVNLILFKKINKIDMNESLKTLD